MDTRYCAERFLESCFQFSKKSKHKLTIYMVNNEKAKTESIERAIEDFVDLQGALQISSSQTYIPGKSNGSKQRAKSPEPTSSYRSKLEMTGSIKQTPRFSQSVREDRRHDSDDTTRDMVASVRNSDFNVSTSKVQKAMSLTRKSHIPGCLEQSVTSLTADACLTADPGVASLIQAQSHTLAEIDHEIISTVILLPSVDSFKKGCQ